jgi:hypothetical protein
MTIKIAFSCNWGHSSEELLVFLARQTPGGSGVWGELEGVASPSDADYLVVLEDLPDSIKPGDIDLQRTIFLPREPKAVRERKNYESFRAPLAFTHADIHQASVWRLMPSFEDLVSSEYCEKPRLLSSVTSAANQTQGHRTRMKFLCEFARRHPGLLDVYGYGWKDELGASYKGEIGNRFAKATDLAALCKLDGLRDYRYSLAFENCRQENYFSEKAVDCWLAWSLPIYWGCPNLSSYFPREAFHEIDPARSDCIDRVAEIVSRPIGENEVAAMREARRLVLQRYNIWPTLDEIVAGRRPNRVAASGFLQRMLALLKGS